jgi:hypothetical protein
MRPRVSNSGPELTFSDFSDLLLPWLVEYNTRSTAGEADELTSGVAAQTTLSEIVVPVPTLVLPTGFTWALRAEFTGNVEALVDTGTTASMQHTLQVLTATPGDWETLSPADTGRSVVPLDGDDVPGTGEYESIGLHATCPLASLPDPALTSRTVRIQWALLAAGATASIRYATDAENETGGWDFTVKWVVEPTA